MKRIQLNDIAVAYRESGTEEAANLILLHGNSESKALFAPYQEKYFAHYHTFALDSRGHGDSISNDTSLSINQMSDDVIGFCEKMGIDKTCLIGYSDGGNIALFLARKRPDIFEKIIAVSPNYLVNGIEDKALRGMKRRYGWFKFWHKFGFRTSKQIMQFELMLNDIGLTDNDLQSIHADLCILHAQNDMIKEEHIRQIAQLIPHAQRVKIAHCNHFNIIRNESAIRRMRAFLE
jgi:pimeloyl-ACP methyl ester carboxylesterase